MSVDEFLKLPEVKPYLELHDGVVVQKVSPQGQHSSLQLSFGGYVDNFGRSRKLARAFSELRGKYGRSVYLPDIAVYRWERVPRGPDGKIRDVFEFPPDIAIEIISPGQTIREIVTKAEDFLEHGVEIAVIVNYQREWTRRLGPGSIDVTFRDADRIDLDPVLPGFDLTADALFDMLRD